MCDPWAAVQFNKHQCKGSRQKLKRIINGQPDRQGWGVVTPPSLTVSIFENVGGQPLQSSWLLIIRFSFWRLPCGKRKVEKIVFVRSACAWRKMQTLPPKLWRGKKNPVKNIFLPSGWIFGNGILGTIPEVVFWCCPSKNDFPPRCDSRNLGLSPLCDLDRNIPMPARYNNAVLCNYYWQIPV